MALAWTPPLPDQSRPPVVSVLTLAAIQLAMTAAMVAVQALLSMQSSGMALTGVTVGAMSYATLAEQRVPNALSQGSILRWFSLGVCLVQLLIAIPVIGAYWVEPEPDAPPVQFLLMIGLPIGMALGMALGFLATWLGLWWGRKLARKQREKLAATNAAKLP